MTVGFLQRLFCWAAFVSPGGYTVRPALHRWRGMRIGPGVWISQLVYFDVLYPEAITIGRDCTIGLRTTIFTHFHWGPKRTEGGFKPVVIEDDVFVGPHCLILPGVHIGRGAVIKGGSVVSRDVPAHTFWGTSGGAPLAEVTVPLTPQHSYDEFVRGLRPFRTGAERVTAGREALTEGRTPDVKV